MNITVERYRHDNETEHFGRYNVILQYAM